MPSSTRLPYADAGLSPREAAAFALDRLAFGPTPEAVDRVLEMGLETWIEAQIRADLPEPEAERRVAALDDYDRPLAWLETHYRRPDGVSQEARAAGYIPDDAEKNSDAYREGTQRYMRERGLRPFRQLVPVLVGAKLQRAVHAQNQLREVLADFWFNHFNVTARLLNVHRTLAYDRDAIRPRALGRFRDLLGATARHPAMLVYLNNDFSRAEEGAPTPAGPARRGGGINENYGRELLELHTVGVDSGYTQADVEAAARAFTGWTVYPYARPERERRWRQQLRRVRGVVTDEEFLFRPDWHDAAPKTVLGTPLPAGRGIEDGEAVLDLLAEHPSTARHLARKLAVRFVADDPPAPVVGALAEAFAASGGDTRTVMRALVRRPEFWAAATGADGQPTKVKTPLELVVSAVRATGARVAHTRALARELEAMGEPIYFREPPTGFPDHAAAWINPGLLLARMRFGLRLASGAVPGVRPDLAALARGARPATAPEALGVYGAALLPGRDLGPTTDVLEEMVLAQDVAARVESAAEEAAPEGDGMQSMTASGAALQRQRPRDGTRGRQRPSGPSGEGYDAATVVGVLLGSPAFQRQ